jgi:ferritin
MMISAKMAASLNQQIANELNASHNYLAMSYCFEHMGLKVFAQRFAGQADEERGHALRIARFIQDVGGKVTFVGVAQPRASYPTAKAIVKAAVDSELTVTKQINGLMAQAEKERDYATRSFLKWFVDEQVEEVSSMTELLQLVTTAGEENLFHVEARLMQAMSVPKSEV